MKKYHTLYKTYNVINDNYYIGVHSTNHNPLVYYDGYLGGGTRLNNAINKYGEKNFEFLILVIIQSREEVLRLEKLYIKHFLNDPKCYNIAEGGLGGLDWSKNLDNWRERDPDAYYEHVRTAGEKASKAMRAFYENPNNRKKISDGMKYRWKDPQYREYMLQKQKERVISKKEIKTNLEKAMSRLKRLEKELVNPNNSVRYQQQLKMVKFYQKQV